MGHGPETWFAVNFGSLRILPTSVWNDSNFNSKEALIQQASAPYMRTGMTQDSTRLQDESGFSKLWKAPRSPFAKKALHALQICSSTDFWLEESEHHQTPRHLTDSTTGTPATKGGGSIPSLPALTIPHFSVLNFRPFLSAKEATVLTRSSVSSGLVAVARMSSECAKAPKKSPWILRPYRSVPRKCAPPFATLALVHIYTGLYPGCDISLAFTPSASVDAGFVLALPFHHGDLEPDCA